MQTEDHPDDLWTAAKRVAERLTETYGVIVVATRRWSPLSVTEGLAAAGEPFEAIRRRRVFSDGWREIQPIAAVEASLGRRLGARTSAPGG